MFYYYYYFIFRKWGAKDTCITQSTEKCMYITNVCVNNFVCVLVCVLRWDSHVLHKLSIYADIFHTESDWKYLALTAVSHILLYTENSMEPFFRSANTSVTLPQPVVGYRQILYAAAFKYTIQSLSTNGNVNYVCVYAVLFARTPSSIWDRVCLRLNSQLVFCRYIYVWYICIYCVVVSFSIRLIVRTPEQRFQYHIVVSHSKFPFFPRSNGFFFRKGGIKWTCILCKICMLPNRNQFRKYATKLYFRYVTSRHTISHISYFTRNLILSREIFTSHVFARFTLLKIVPQNTL